MSDTIKNATDAAQDAGNKVAAEAKKAVADGSILAQAQEAVTDAFTATVEAVKEHPVAAAAIAGGAAVAVAGAVYGANKLRADEG